MSTSIHRIELALQGRSNLIMQILQAVFGKPKDPTGLDALAEQPADPDAAAHQLLAFVERNRKNANRLASKKKPKK